MSACSTFAVAPLTPLPPSPTPLPWADAADVMSSLCFEAVNDAAGQTFVIRSADELAQFYDLADNSELCRRPVARAGFDFSSDRILIGTWTRAVGCTAQHEVLGTARDDSARKLLIILRLAVDGDCNYELVRPFWISMSGVSDYDVQIVVQ